MSGSIGKSESSSDAQNTFNQDVWGPQGDALQDLYNVLGGVYGSYLPTFNPAIDYGSSYGTDVLSSIMPYWNDTAQGGVYDNIGIADTLMGSLNDSLNSPSMTSELYAQIMGGEGNDYVDAMKQTLMNDAESTGDLLLRQLDARAAAAGMSGASTHGNLIAEGMEDINDSLLTNMTQLGYDTFDQDLDRKLEIASAADANTLARQDLLANMLGAQQATANTGLTLGGDLYGLGIDQYMLPWTTVGAYGDILGGPTILGSGSGISSGDSKGKSVSGGAK